MEEAKQEVKEEIKEEPKLEVLEPLEKPPLLDESSIMAQMLSAELFEC